MGEALDCSLRHYTVSAPDGTRLAVVNSPGSEPLVMFLGGFRSDMTGFKACFLQSHCRARGRAFLRFDYSGHGQSDGRFMDGTISRWTGDALAVLDAAAERRVILVGSSMGVWIALLVALARRARVVGLLGIAGAPDFTESLIWQQLGRDGRAALRREGVLHRPSAYGEPDPITLGLVEDGRRRLVLEAAIPLTCPVRLLHGLADTDVPWQHSLRLAERLAGSDVRLTLVKGGDHRLSTAADLGLIAATLAELIGAAVSRPSASGRKVR